MPWTWTCHKCHTRYLLGATRRCLLDGHYFCGGTTVDKISGKVKKHRACVSEFDYSGWEDFGRWKRATSGHFSRPGSKHCEDECNFPSSCHWTEQHAVQKYGVKIHDSDCLDQEPDRSSLKGELTVNKDARNYIGRFRRSAEKHTTHVAKALLSPIEGEEQKAFSSINTASKLNGLGFHSPVMDFSISKQAVNKSRGLMDKAQRKLSTPKSEKMSVHVDQVSDDHLDRSDWMTSGATGSRPVSHRAQPNAVEVPFEFGLEQDHGLLASLIEDDTSATPPMRSTWEWTVGGIGVAVSPPSLPVGDEILGGGRDGKKKNSV